MENNHKLRQDFDLLNFHINNSPLAFIEWDEHFQIKIWSPRAQKLFGYTEQEVMGLSPLDLGFLDANTRREIKEKMDELLQTGHSSNRIETYVRTKSGQFLFVELYNSAMLDETGQLISAVSFAHDITERKKTEKRIHKNEALLSQLFKNSPIGIVRLNKRDSIIDINRSFEQLFGYSLDEIRGRTINSLIVPDGEQDQADQISRLTHAGKSSQTEAIRIHKDGTEVPVLVAGVPVTVGDETIAIYGMYVDLTERKQAEEEIRRSLKEKETLLAEIHHRVKNNLALVSGLLELQVYNSRNDEVKDALRYSQSRIMSMAMVHERLYQSDTLSELNCLEFINKLAESISETHYTREKNIELELNADSFELNVTQAVPLGLILNELLVNAYKHAFQNADEGLISVELTKCDENVCLRVSDNGKGFPDNLNTEATKSLGMTLINTLTKQLKGTLTMNNENGSFFEIKFKME